LLDGIKPLIVVFTVVDMLLKEEITPYDFNSDKELKLPLVEAMQYKNPVVRGCPAVKVTNAVTDDFDDVTDIAEM
jgi:hypothetical protein